MGSTTERLMKLRPVTFRYNSDPSGALQYGLVAEEVAKVYPELVVYGPDGKVMTVRYSMLSAMLLNELQKQTRENQRLATLVNNLSAQMVAIRLSNRREVAGLKAHYERDLWSIQERLAAIEQATGKTKLASWRPLSTDRNCAPIAQGAQIFAAWLSAFRAPAAASLRSLAASPPPGAWPRPPATEVNPALLGRQQPQQLPPLGGPLLGGLPLGLDAPGVNVDVDTGRIGRVPPSVPRLEEKADRPGLALLDRLEQLAGRNRLGLREA